MMTLIDDNGNVFKSTDSGKTWELVEQRQKTTHVRAPWCQDVWEELWTGGSVWEANQ